MPMGGKTPTGGVENTVCRGKPVGPSGKIL
jgi:hypothetical protein